jgi:uncharacterized protein YyaL (SSP411 family)
MFYYTSDQAEKLVARKMEIADNVIPSSNSTLEIATAKEFSHTLHTMTMK